MKPICCRSQNQPGNGSRVGRFQRPGIHTYFRLRVRGKLYCATLPYYFDSIGLTIVPGTHNPRFLAYFSAVFSSLANMTWPPTSQRGKSCLVIFLANTVDVPVSNNFLSYADAINIAPAAKSANRFRFIFFDFVGRGIPARVLHIFRISLFRNFLFSFVNGRVHQCCAVVKFVLESAV